MICEQFVYDDMSYTVYDSHTPQRDMPENLGYFQLWHDKCGENDFPMWQDFQLIELKPWIARFVLAENLRDPFDFKIEIFGSKLVSWFGAELTGMTFRQVFQGWDGNRAQSILTWLEALWSHKGFGVGTFNLGMGGKDYMRVRVFDAICSKENHKPTHFMSYWELLKT